MVSRASPVHACRLASSWAASRTAIQRTQIIDAYPQLKAEDIKAALKFAAEAVNNADFMPLDRAGCR